LKGGILLATIKDIAREAGVSHGTVSNVLNKTGKVSTEKIQMVEEVAKRLGYKVNVQARQLRGGSSRIICVILPNIQLQSYVDLYDQIQQIFTAADYDVILYTTNRIPASEKKIWEKAFSLKPDAVICSTCLEQIPDQNMIDFPIVLIDYIHQSDNHYISYATFDFAAAANEIAFFVQENQFTNVALFTTSGASACKTLFCQTLTELLSAPIKVTPFSSDDKLMFHKSFEIVSSKEEYDLIITFSSEQAECIHQASMHTKTTRLPRIISLASYRTIPDSRFLSYELNYKYMGRHISEKLLENIQEEQLKTITFSFVNEGFRYRFPYLTKIENCTINILTLESPASNALNMILPDFYKRTGITANLTILPFDELYDTIRTMGGSGYYDLIRSDVAWLSHLAEKTYLPLEESAINVDAILDSLIDDTKDSFTKAGDTIYTLPFDPSIQLLFYRSDLFEDAKVRRQYYELNKEELNVPNTFEEYNKIAAFFTRDINPASPVSHGTTLTFGSAGVAACDFLPRLLAMKKSTFNEEGILTVNTPAIMGAMNNYIQTYRCTDRSVNKWWKQSVENFSKGDTAMTITFSNHASHLINSKYSSVVDCLGFSAIPGNTPLLGGGVIGISKASRHPEAACEFLKWVYSDEIASILTVLGGTSANRSIYTSGEITSLFPWLETVRSSFSKGLRRTESFRYPLFNEKTFENILGTAVRSSVTGMMSPKEALDSAQNIINDTFLPI